jgi:hypothetical protein
MQKKSWMGFCGGWVAEIAAFGPVKGAKKTITQRSLRFAETCLARFFDLGEGKTAGLKSGRPALQAW